uniref:Uncharacterized protein n=1 Tax=Anopheles atroparvus TaxID=41427 RepID=A0A182JC32_ANOAO
MKCLKPCRDRELELPSTVSGYNIPQIENMVATVGAPEPLVSCRGVAHALQVQLNPLDGSLYFVDDRLVLAMAFRPVLGADGLRQHGGNGIATQVSYSYNEGNLLEKISLESQRKYKLVH